MQVGSCLQGCWILTDPGPLSLSGFVNSRRQFKKPETVFFSKLSDMRIHLSTAIKHFSCFILLVGAGGMTSCWMCAMDFLHPDIALKKSSWKASPQWKLLFSTDDLRAEPQSTWIEK